MGKTPTEHNSLTRTQFTQLRPTQILQRCQKIGEKAASHANCAEELGIHVRRMKLDLYASFCVRMSSKWVTDPSCKMCEIARERTSAYWARPGLSERAQ